MANNARTFKDNFWCKLRASNGFSLKELGKMLNVDMSSVCHYMTGQQMPPDDIIDGLCKYFDVDPVYGKSEFMKAHETWKAEHTRSVKVKYNNPKKEKVEEKKFEPKSEPMKIAHPVKKVPTFSDEEVLEVIYQKVDFKTFMKVLNIVKEDK